MSHKQKHKNNLMLIRRKLGLERKQVAILLGHKTANEISRFERSIKKPGLKTAFKMQIIYGFPIQILFYGYYGKCLREIRTQEKVLNKNKIQSKDNDNMGLEKTEFCTIAENLKNPDVSDADLDSARNHITKLIHLRGERMDHL